MLNEALDLFLSAHDYGHTAETLRSVARNYKHLHLKTHDPAYAHLMQSILEVSLKIVELHDLKDHYCATYFDLAEAQEELDDLPRAIEYYHKALDLLEGQNAERGRFLDHLGSAQYQAGKREEGKANMLQGLTLIRTHRNQMDSFVADVWESGSLMNLARQLGKDEQDQAQDYLNQAKTIIDRDPQMVIRKRQWEELAKTLAR